MVIVLNGKPSVLGRDVTDEDAKFLAEFLHRVASFKGEKK